MKVFISYSHDSPEHMKNVHDLANRLKNDGISVLLDRDCPPEGPAEGWPKWSEQTAERSDTVLTIFTKSYRRCWDGEQPEGMRLGATHETKVIHARVYNAGQFTRFCRVVVFAKADKDYIPSVIKGLKSFIATEESDYASLLEWLRSKTEVDSTPEQTVVSNEVERNELFTPLLKYAKQRPIVFAVGGVGSGLNTFIRQFGKYLHGNHVHSYTAPDFDEELLSQVLIARDKASNALQGLVMSTERDHLELKCLFASLAYTAYHTLRQDFTALIDAIIPPHCAEDPIRFTDYYFSNSGAMFRPDRGPIVEYFFCTLQNLAKITGIDGVVVLMPWRRLAHIFTASEDGKLKALSKSLWEALADFAVRDAQQDRQATMDNEKAAKKYDKVCFVVATSEIYFGTRPYKQRLVDTAIWPLPPLSVAETVALLATVCPELGDASAAQEMILWTGGSPVLTTIVMSFLHNGLRENAASIPVREVLAKSYRQAEEGIKSGGNGVGKPLRGFIQNYLSRVKDGLGDGTAEDSLIEAAWTGPLRKRESGLTNCPARVEAFVSSGLIWFEGDAWKPFANYPTVKFRKASTLALAAYNNVTNHDLVWSES